MEVARDEVVHDAPPSGTPTAAIAALGPPAPGVWRRLLSNPVAAASLLLLALLALVALLAPVVAPYGYADPDPGHRLAAPSARHLLGTDDQRWDILSRLIYGARISLSVALSVEVVVLGIGLLVGLIAGFLGGHVDSLLMRLTDVLLAFPDVLLAILLLGVFRTQTPTPTGSVLLVILALGATGWPPLARLVRGQVLLLRNREFVDAARALGATNGRILARHILPNLLGPILVAVTVDAAGVIVAEATLAFLGIGVQRPYPSWGRMIHDALPYYRHEPRLVLLPSILLAVTVLALNFLGDGLRDALDPRARKN